MTVVTYERGTGGLVVRAYGEVLTEDPRVVVVLEPNGDRVEINRRFLISIITTNPKDYS